MNQPYHPKYISLLKDVTKIASAKPKYTESHKCEGEVFSGWTYFKGFQQVFFKFTWGDGFRTFLYRREEQTVFLHLQDILECKVDFRLSKAEVLYFKVSRKDCRHLLEIETTLYKNDWRD